MAPESLTTVVAVSSSQLMAASSREKLYQQPLDGVSFHQH